MCIIKFKFFYLIRAKEDNVEIGIISVLSIVFV